MPKRAGAENKTPGKNKHKRTRIGSATRQTCDGRREGTTMKRDVLDSGLTSNEELLARMLLWFCGETMTSWKLANGN